MRMCMCHGEGLEGARCMLASDHHALHHGSAVVERLYLKYFSIVLFCCHQHHSFVIKKISRKEVVLWKWGNHVLDNAGAFVEDRLTSLCGRLGVRWWQDLDGRTWMADPGVPSIVASQGWKETLRSLHLTASTPFSLHHLYNGWTSHVCIPVSLSAYPAAARAPPEPAIWCVSQICAQKQLGLYPVIGNEKPQKDSGPFWTVLLKDQHLCETWIRRETLNQEDKLGGLGQNLGLGGSRLRQVVAWDWRSNGPQKTESPAPSICLSTSVREEEHVNISLESSGGGRWEWSW